MTGQTRKVSVQLPEETASKLTTIAEREGRTLAGELLWLALKRVTRKMGGSVAKGKDDDEVRVMLRMPRELHDRLKSAAEAQERTVSAELRRLIRVELSHEHELAGADPLTGQ